jgi:hypothetical protein
MDRTASASHLLDPLGHQWQELLQRWALDGSISRSELAIRLVARSFAPLLLPPGTAAVAIGPQATSMDCLSHDIPGPTTTSP